MALSQLSSEKQTVIGITAIAKDNRPIFGFRQAVWRGFWNSLSNRLRTYFTIQHMRLDLWLFCQRQCCLTTTRTWVERFLVGEKLELPFSFSISIPYLKLKDMLSPELHTYRIGQTSYRSPTSPGCTKTCMNWLVHVRCWVLLVKFEGDHGGCL